MQRRVARSKPAPCNKVVGKTPWRRGCPRLQVVELSPKHCEKVIFFFRRNVSTLSVIGYTSYEQGHNGVAMLMQSRDALAHWAGGAKIKF